MLWYYAQGGQRQGPVEEVEIRRLIAAGQLGRADLVWRTGLAEWIPAGEAAELTSSFQPVWAPPPSPPPPPPPAPAPAQFSPYAPPAAPLVQPPSAYGGMQPAGALAAPEYASFKLRLVAMLIDQILLMCVGGGLGFGLGLAVTAGGVDPSGLSYLWNAIGFLLSWLYYAGMESSEQRATIGKNVLGLKVTDLQGQRIDFGRATGRYFGKILSTLPLLLGYILMISDERKQTWHDKMANCLVLRVPR
jgi:uncharacterized RDD family membrane protein YckC